MKQMLFLAKVLRILHVLYHGKKVECSQVVTTNIYLKAWISSKSSRPNLEDFPYLWWAMSRVEVYLAFFLTNLEHNCAHMGHGLPAV